MNNIRFANYATLSRKFRGQRGRTNIRYGRKSQTVSGQSRKLSTASIEFQLSKNPDSLWKISQKPSAKFGINGERRRL